MVINILSQRAEVWILLSRITNSGDSPHIETSLQMLREAIVGDVEAVKATICSWTSERRWCAVLLLEEVAEGELRKLEQMIPSFYAWLG